MRSTIPGIHAGTAFTLWLNLHWRKHVDKRVAVAKTALREAAEWLRTVDDQLPSCAFLTLPPNKVSDDLKATRPVRVKLHVTVAES
jgi:hypothetical protein